jgi:diaminopimelate epimerase
MKEAVAFQTIIEALYWRSISRDEKAISEVLNDQYKLGWRVKLMTVDDGLPHFVMERERIERIKLPVT